MAIVVKRPNQSEIAAVIEMKGSTQAIASANRKKDEEWGSYIRQPLIAPPELSCREAIQLFRQNPESECLVVCTPLYKPLGILMRPRFFLKLGQRFSAELWYDKPIEALMDQQPLIVDAKEEPQQVISRALQRQEHILYDCVLVTSQERLHGILTVSDLLKLSSALQEKAILGQIAVIASAETGLQQIKDVISEVHRSAKQGEQQAIAMSELMNSGRGELGKVTDVFQSILSNALVQQEQMKNLQQEAGAIYKVTDLIKGLAEQSNLLAVNASIEAARAGEHGRGFAVVAEQVMKLANETKQLANEITRITKAVIHAIEDTAAAVETGKDETLASRQFVKKTETVFDQLMNTAHQNEESGRHIGKLAEHSYQHAVLVADEMEKLRASYEN